jgi:hypothetical protein
LASVHADQDAHPVVEAIERDNRLLRSSLPDHAEDR